MKKMLLGMMVVLMLAFAANAQTTLNLFGGYGKSAFDLSTEDGEDEEVSQAGYIPVGVQVLFGNTVQFGAEFNYAVVPFTFEYKMGDTKLGDLKVNQMIIGALARFNLGTGDFRPFIRGGAGMYMGDSKFEYTDEFKNLGAEDETIDFKSALGFNFGAGVVSQMGEKNAFFAEFVYHIVKREADVEGAEKEKANNWAIHVGYQIGL